MANKNCIDRHFLTHLGKFSSWVALFPCSVQMRKDYETTSLSQQINRSWNYSPIKKGKVESRNYSVFIEYVVYVLANPCGDALFMVLFSFYILNNIGYKPMTIFFFNCVWKHLMIKQELFTEGSYGDMLITVPFYSNVGSFEKSNTTEI